MRPYQALYVCLFCFVPMLGWYIGWILPYCGVLCLCRTGHHRHSSEAVMEITWRGVQVLFFRGGTNVNGPNTLRDFFQCMRQILSICSQCFDLTSETHERADNTRMTHTVCLIKKNVAETRPRARRMLYTHTNV